MMDASPATRAPRTQPGKDRQVQIEDRSEFPRGEVFGGFSYRRFKDLNTFGWNGELVGNVNRWFGIVGDFSGHYKSAEVLGTNVASVEFYSLMAGPQFAGRHGRVTVFSRGMVGGTNGSAYLFGTNVESLWVLSFSAGGGVDVGINRNLAIRVFQGDGIWTRYQGETGSSGRWAFGVVGRW
jgi:hypothetical protein